MPPTVWTSTAAVRKSGPFRRPSRMCPRRGSDPPQSRGRMRSMRTMLESPALHANDNPESKRTPHYPRLLVQVGTDAGMVSTHAPWIRSRAHTLQPNKAARCACALPAALTNARPTLFLGAWGAGPGRAGRGRGGHACGALICYLIEDGCSGPQVRPTPSHTGRTGWC